MVEGAVPMEVNTSPARKSSGSMKHTGAFAGAPYRVDKKKVRARGDARRRAEARGDERARAPRTPPGPRGG